MSQASPFSTMQHVLEILDDIFMRRAARALTEKDNTALKEFIGSLLLTRRLNMIRSHIDAEQLWHDIRANEVAADFILNIAAELQVWLDLSSLPYDKFVGQLAAAYGQNHTKAKVSVIEKDLLERLPSADELNMLYTSNPWLVALMTIGMRGIAVLNHFPNVGRANPPRDP
jgi:hypothetical protein